MIPLADTQKVVDAFLKGDQTEWDRSHVLMDRETGLDMYEIDHVRQSILVILTTRVGTRVGMRQFGSRLLDLLDSPITEITPAALAYEIAVSCQWEPRIIVNSVDISPDSDLAAGQITFAIFGVYVIDGKAVALHGLQIDRNKIVQA